MTTPLPLKNANRFYASIAQYGKRIFNKQFLAVCLVAIASQASGQNLILSTSGQTGTSGTNWTTSGTNPVTINVTGPAGINTSVITGYLNAGVSVIVNNNNVGTRINSDIIKSAGSSATLTIKDISFVRTADNVSINSTSGMLNIIFWADADLSQGGAVDDYIYTGAGSTFQSNGGLIVMAGGPDNGANGGLIGDGIPDGFAWNGSALATYGANIVGGLTLGPRTGLGTVVSLLSNGGDIILRGATSNNNAFPGITSQANLKIESGAGRIIMFGQSTTGNGVEFTYGAAPNIAIHSSSVSSPAIDIKGTTTSFGNFGLWAANSLAGDVLIQSSAATGGGITLEGVSTSASGLYLGAALTTITTQLLSQSGTINLKGDGGVNASLLMYGDVWVGNRKDATPVQGVTPIVTASSANILVQADDQFYFSNTVGRNVNMFSTGALIIEAYTTGYTGMLSWVGNLVTGSNFNNITFGESAENYGVTVTNSFTAAGNISAYTSDFILGTGNNLISTVAGYININARGSFTTAGGLRRTISTVNGSIDIFADWDASGNGALDIDYLTLNAGTGNIRLRCETAAWNVLLDTDKPYINGTGTFTFEPSDASFMDLNTSWFVFDQDANGMAGLTLRKLSNTGIILHDVNAINVAGPIAFLGGWVIADANLTSSASGDIFFKANSTRNLAPAIDARASIFKTAGTGTLTMQSRDRVNGGTITASGTGRLNVVLWSDYSNDNNGGVSVSGAVTTNGGHFWAGGSATNAGTYTWNGLTVGDGASVGAANNNYNAMDFNGSINTNGGDVLMWAGTGFLTGTNGIGVLAAGRSISTGTGNITLISDDIASNDITINTTGKLSLVPFGGSYPSSVNWGGSLSGGNFNATGLYDALLINSFANLGGLTIGYFDGQLQAGVPVRQTNSTAITTNAAISILGPVTLYGNSLTVNQNIASTAAGNISLFGNTLSIAAGPSISSSANLIIAPVTNGTTIGLLGGTGTLQVTANNFNNNFVDGFSEIQIGNTNAGLVTSTVGVVLKDNLRLITATNFNMNEIIEIGNNDFRFEGVDVNAAATKYIRTNGTGRFFMNIANNASKLFPVGISALSPLTITNRIGSTDTYYAAVSTGVNLNGGITGTLVPWMPRVDLTWRLGNTSGHTGAGNVDLQFGWNASNVLGTLVAPRLLRHTGATWSLLSTVPTSDLVNRTTLYPSYTGALTSFAIAENNITLPVNWLSFNGRRVQDDVELNWTTGAEQNNNYFEVERKGETGDFVAIGRVAAATNPGNQNSYRFVDQEALTTRSYYRIKQVDLDGRSTYTEIIMISNLAIKSFTISKVPGQTQLLVTAPSSLTAKTTLSIYDGNGREVMKKQITAGRTSINTSSLVSGGVYFIQITADGKMLHSDKFVN